MTGTGTLTGVGVGPGDPALLTLKAAACIAAAPVLAFVTAAGRPPRARGIAALHIRAGTRELCAGLPMGDAPATAAAYDALAAEIAAVLEAGTDVAFLCEGDPLLYGSFAYLLERLRHRFACAVIPGITSMTAAAAASLRPLALREETLAIVPATASERDLAAALAGADAAVVLKVGRHLDPARAALAAASLAGNALVAQAVGTAEERLTPLSAVTGDTIPYFSLILARRAIDFA